MKIKKKTNNILIHKIFQNYSQNIKLKNTSKYKQNQLLPLKIHHLKIPKKHIYTIITIFPSLQQTPIPTTISITNSQHTKHQKKIKNSNLYFTNTKIKIQIISISISLFKKKTKPNKKYNLTIPIKTH